MTNATQPVEVEAEATKTEGQDAAKQRPALGFDGQPFLQASAPDELWCSESSKQEGLLQRPEMSVSTPPPSPLDFRIFVCLAIVVLICRCCASCARCFCKTGDDGEEAQDSDDEEVEEVETVELVQVADAEVQTEGELHEINTVPKEPHGERADLEHRHMNLPTPARAAANKDQREGRDPDAPECSSAASSPRDSKAKALESSVQSEAPLDDETSQITVDLDQVAEINVAEAVEDIVAEAEDDIARAELLLREERWVLDDPTGIIFEEEEDELTFHTKRSKMLGYFARAFRDQLSIREAGAALLDDIERLEEEKRAYRGDAAYWRTLAEERASKQRSQEHGSHESAEVTSPAMSATSSCENTPRGQGSPAHA
jgi:hypothetical protein